jgi:hypothetical protein
MRSAAAVAGAKMQAGLEAFAAAAAAAASAGRLQRGPE